MSDMNKLFQMLGAIQATQAEHGTKLGSIQDDVEDLKSVKNKVIGACVFISVTFTAVTSGAVKAIASFLK